jgi:hypothetical protein
VFCFFPRGLEAGGDGKHVTSAPRLFAPAAQYVHCLIIQWHMTGLTAFGIPALYGEESVVKVHGRPAQLEGFTAPQASVQAEQDGRRQMIAEVDQWRQQRLISPLPPIVSSPALILHFPVAIHESFSEP